MPVEGKNRRTNLLGAGISVLKDAGEVSSLIQAGFELGVYVRVVAEEGQTHSNDLGQTFTIEQGKAFVKVEPTSKYKGRLMGRSLVPLWNRASKLREASSQ